MKSVKEWISISDMMTGLMMVFLFLSVLYMNQIQKEGEKKIKETKKSTEKIKKITKEYKNYKGLILNKLKQEFKKDLKKWNAEIIDESMVIRFLSPDIMFNPMESVIKEEFKSILNSFCPRYFKLLYEFREGIEEIRIEGHTSDEWIGASIMEAYFNNMKLSQDRTRSVLKYCITIQNNLYQNLITVLKNKIIGGNINGVNISKWTVKTLTANGLSSSSPICKKNTMKCRSFNRRVEFRIQVNDSSVLYKLINEVENIFNQSIFPMNKNSM